MVHPGNAAPPSNGLAGAILATIFCCLPFGVVAIVYAAQVDSATARGDHFMASELAGKAKNWTVASVLTGVGVGLLYFCFAMEGM